MSVKLKFRTLRLLTEKSDENTDRNKRSLMDKTTDRDIFRLLRFFFATATDR